MSRSLPLTRVMQLHSLGFFRIVNIMVTCEHRSLLRCRGFCSGLFNPACLSRRWMVVCPTMIDSTLCRYPSMSMGHQPFSRLRVRIFSTVSGGALCIVCGVLVLGLSPSNPSNRYRFHRLQSVLLGTCALVQISWTGTPSPRFRMHHCRSSNVSWFLHEGTPDSLIS